MRRLVPSSLTSRLVVTSVALVALVSLLIAAATTLAIRSYLFDRLDGDVRQAVTHAAGSRGPVSQVPAPDRESREHGSDVDAAFGPGTGLLTAKISGNQGSGWIFREGELAYLSSDVLTRLGQAPADGTPHSVELPGLGTYRLMIVDRGGTKSVAGLPIHDVQATVDSLLGWELLFTLGGVLAAGGIALVVVRRQMRPLREVASTAHEVAGLPLASGEIGMTARVPGDLTDERTEVGQVGAALNTLLGHVEQALDERHRSEQQVRQFVADASHELRTPLATIKGYAELSRRASPPDVDRLGHAMGKVEVEAARMSSLVEDLLLLARLDAGRPLERNPVDLTKLVLEAAGDARVLGPDHRWKLDLGEEPVVVTGDDQRLHQAVTNLLSNARRHTPSGTTVTAGARLSDDGRAALVTVHDDGPGIPETIRSSLFERFTRGDSARTRQLGGAGLGLSLVRAIAEAHGGRIRVDSQPGSTTFTLSLPRGARPWAEV